MFHTLNQLSSVAYFYDLCALLTDKNSASGKDYWWYFCLMLVLRVAAPADRLYVLQSKMLYLLNDEWTVPLHYVYIAIRLYIWYCALYSASDAIDTGCIVMILLVMRKSIQLFRCANGR